MSKGEYCNDCIHLKACRRLCKIAKVEHGKQITRGCNENCGAYETLEDLIEENDERYYTANEVHTIMHGVIRDVQRGYTDLIISDYV